MNVPTHQQKMRELVLARYGNLARAGLRHRLRFHLKRAGWAGVVQGSYLLKRLLDIIASAILLVLLTPLFLAVALAIRIESPGPVLFRQIRVGRWGGCSPCGNSAPCMPTPRPARRSC